MKLLFTLVTIPIVFIVIIGSFTGNRESFIGSHDDERKKAIKQKSIV